MAATVSVLGLAAVLTAKVTEKIKIKMGTKTFELGRLKFSL